MDGNYIIGGKLLATGSKSCIFRPNITCNTNKKIKKSKISKIIYGPKSNSLLKQEKSINEKIRRIKGYNKWALTYEHYCKPDKYNKLIIYDKDMEKCLKDIKTPDAINKFNKVSVMMIGNYGGITLETYFEKHFSNISKQNLRKEFLKLMKKMEPLFLGLNEMEKKKIIHKDIKYNNVVIHQNIFKFIDFGLASELKDFNHFKDRALNEFNTNRLYSWYPLEYIFNFSNNDELDYEINRILINKPRKGMDLFVTFNKIFQRDINLMYDETIQRIKNRLVDTKKMFSLIDVYSLGIMVPLLFLTKSSITNPYDYDVCISEFYGLFSKMTEPIYTQRIEPGTCYSTFSELLKKYS